MTWYRGRVSPTYPDAEHLRLLREELAGRSRLQAEEFDGLDRKGTTTLAANGVVLGLVLSNVENFTGVAGWSPVLFNLALILLAIGLVLGTLELWPRAFHVVPRPRQFVTKYYAKEVDETMAMLLSTNLRAFERNEGLARQKGRLLRGQMLLLAIGGSLLVTSYLVKELLK